jgi:extracellular elastinolytic metalloproteinase
MHPHSLRRGRRAGLALGAFGALASLASTAIAGGTSYPGGDVPGGGHSLPSTASHAAGHRVSVDPEVDVTSRRVHAVSGTPASESFRAAASDSTVLDISGATGTVRFLADLDGYLTPPSAAPATRITLEYVRTHATALGLTRADVRSFHLERNYRDITGTHHLYFTQHIDGRTVARNGLSASVAETGRLLTVAGSPISKAGDDRLPPASAYRITTAAEALAETRGPKVTGTDTSDDTAQRVVVETAGGARPAWETVVTSSPTPATTVIDAVSGRVLLRSPLRHYEHSTGRVFKFFPGAAHGGRQVQIDFTAHHWLGGRARTLAGNNAHVYSDVDDNERPSRSEEVPPLSDQSWGYRLKPFHLGFAKSFCGKPWPCSWNPDKAYSWKRNRAQNATQVFFFVNNWHDHLKRAPIGFTEAAGNFQLVNHSHQGKAGDPVRVQTDDGAATGRGDLEGLPDSHHIDNSDMFTPPDGHRPKMQLYLQHHPFTSYPQGGHWSPTNSGDIADTVYHEYTHGLSSRLVVDVRGRETLDPVQGDSMGEAWSDWYAMDYLVDQHLQPDLRGVADVRLGIYEGDGANHDRTEPMDCKVGQDAKPCNGGSTGHRGGYTYADFGHVIGEPEVHADGEIWGQTLWDLRDSLGSRTAESLVTRAMELAPSAPSFLDMRNAILVADTSVDQGRHHTAIWQVFAHRGMGFYAGTLGAGDTAPAASFAMPPATVQTGTITGVATDRDTGEPIEGASVSLAFGGSAALDTTAVTDADGEYAIAGVPQGSYGKLVLAGHGYRAARSVTVGPGGAAANFHPHHT